MVNSPTLPCHGGKPVDWLKELRSSYEGNIFQLEDSDLLANLLSRAKPQVITKKIIITIAELDL